MLFDQELIVFIWMQSVYPGNVFGRAAPGWKVVVVSCCRAYWV